MKGLFITFEGTEGSGKSTQITLLAEKLRAMGRTVRMLREPGGTPIGEEIRHTLKHSNVNHAMTSETELLLMNASRAQLVREIIRPALAAGETILCDRFYHSTLAYQGYGRQLEIEKVQQIIDFAVGDTRPDVTLFLHVPVHVSEQRRLARQALLFPPDNAAGKKNAAPLPFTQNLRDRMEEADRSFFERVEKGYEAILKTDKRIRFVDATGHLEQVRDQIWAIVGPLAS